jgi:hypothetical protein
MDVERNRIIDLKYRSPVLPNPKLYMCLIHDPHHFTEQTESSCIAADLQGGVVFESKPGPRPKILVFLSASMRMS